MAESSFKPLDTIEGYRENTGGNETSTFFKQLSLHESDVEGEYNDLKSNVTDGDKSFSVMRISNPNDSGINAGENASDEVKNIARTPKKVEKFINEPEASLHPWDSCDPQNTKQEKNRNESSINTEDLARTLKRALSAGAVRSRNKICSLDNKVDYVKKEMKEVKKEMEDLKKEMEELKKEMKEVKKENALLRIEMAGLRQSMGANAEN
ncbi:uncharacterized protein [Diadema antillarum]|uniref:uncharacterized protein n=1 Tax=Diadema antillarum TaxID=105358 RepID=UPI003A8A2EBC